MSTTTSSSRINESVEKFFSQYSGFSAAPGDILIPAQEARPAVFFLQDGLIKQTTIAKNGAELSLNLYKPGAFFPLLTAFTGLENEFTFQAVLPSSGWKAPAEEVLEFIRRNPEVSFDLTRRLFLGLHGTLRKTSQLMQGDARRLLIDLLLTLAQRFPGKEEKEILGVNFTHQQLADLVGLSRETVTRELSELKQNGYISIEKHVITLLDPQALRAELSL